ncbi:hypothetical protein SNEBB_000955 [Seison nebaliae]|nr:hypothetical protein SNEBB_000955 [Seison nebaliae]
MTANHPINIRSLTQEISDEFLTCKICLERYKDPKALSCLHSFCGVCILEHLQNGIYSNSRKSFNSSYKFGGKDFSCPLCRQKTKIPLSGVNALPDNFVIKNLTEMIRKGEERRSTVPKSFCDICRQTKKIDNLATCKCVDCNKLMCEQCSQQHRSLRITATHTFYELNMESVATCSIHPSENVRFFCERCDECVCVICTFTQHSDHELLDFHEGVKQHRSTLMAALNSGRKEMDELNNYLMVMKDCQLHMLQTENKIHESASQYVKIIRESETAVIEQLHKYYGEDGNSIIRKKELVERHLEELKQTCSLAHLAVENYDVELLLLKKKILEKFDIMSNNSLWNELKESNMNTGFQFHLTFLSNSIEFGRLSPCSSNDDRTNLSKPIDKISLISLPPTNNQGKKERRRPRQWHQLHNDDNDDGNDDDGNGDENELTPTRVDSNRIEEVKKEMKDRATNYERGTQLYRWRMIHNFILEKESQTDIRMIHDLVKSSTITSSMSRKEQQKEFDVSTQTKQIQQVDECEQVDDHNLYLESASIASSLNLSTLTLDKNNNNNNNNHDEQRKRHAHFADVDLVQQFDRSLSKESDRTNDNMDNNISDMSCGVAMLNSEDVIVIDPDAAAVSILTLSGEVKYAITPQPTPTNYKQGYKRVNINTPQGLLFFGLIDSKESIKRFEC